MGKLQALCVVNVFNEARGPKLEIDKQNFNISDIYMYIILNTYNVYNFDVGQ